jgi:hypothetical protein
MTSPLPWVAEICTLSIHHRRTFKTCFLTFSLLVRRKHILEGIPISLHTDMRIRPFELCRQSHLTLAKSLASSGCHYILRPSSTWAPPHASPSRYQERSPSSWPTMSRPVLTSILTSDTRSGCRTNHAFKEIGLNDW